MLEMEADKYSPIDNQEKLLLGFHSEIFKDAIFYLAGGTALAVFSSGILYFASEQLNSFLNLFIVLLILSGLFISINRTIWYLRASWMINHLNPVKSTFFLRKDDPSNEKAVFAEINFNDLYPDLYQSGLSNIWRVKVQVKNPEIDSLINCPIEADLFCNSDHSAPIVIRTNFGIIWPESAALPWIVSAHKDN